MSKLTKKDLQEWVDKSFKGMSGGPARVHLYAGKKKLESHRQGFRAIHGKEKGDAHFLNLISNDYVTVFTGTAGEKYLKEFFKEMGVEDEMDTKKIAVQHKFPEK